MTPRPEPWVLALAAALSAALAVVVAFQVLAALREWRLRNDALGRCGTTGVGGRTCPPRPRWSAPRRTRRPG